MGQSVTKRASNCCFGELDRKDVVPGTTENKVFIHSEHKPWV